MATLTKSTGTVTLSGAVEKVTFPAVYGWVWVKNMSDGDMFVGLDDGVSAGADGVLSIPAGECGRIQTDGQDSVYLNGSGNALVVAQNYADCPFKVGGKGGEIPDLSVYAKTADVPNIKVNSAVDADTVGGHSVNADVPENAVFTDTIPDLSPYAKKTDIPTELPANGGNADTVDGLHADDFVNATDKGQIQIPNNSDVPAWIYANGKRYQEYMTNGVNIGLTNVPNDSIDWVWYWYDGVNIIAREWAIGRYYICDVINGGFSGWKDVYTSGYKPYVTGTLSEQASGSDVTLGFTIFDFTPSKVICQFGNGNAFFANVVTNGFSLTIPAGTTTIHYIAFK